MFKDHYFLKRKAFPPCTLLLAHSNVAWLTGFDSAYLLIGKDEDYLMVPELEYERAKESVPWINVIKVKRRALPIKEVKEICKSEPIVADLKYLDFSTAIRLVTDLGAGDISDKVKEERMKKDEYEVEIIKKALGMSETAFLEAWGEIREGMTELEAAGLLEHKMREKGATWFAFPTIVAFGENSSKPHAVPGYNTFDKEKIALFDFGAKYGPYNSDITRTYVPDKMPYVEWMDAVLEAINAALKALRPGVKGSEVDRAAREVIKEYGFGDAFVHGLGHGVGVDIHEPPYLAPSYDAPIPKGAVVTVEPGVYFPGKGGVRVEQLVYVNAKPLVLNSTNAVWW